MLKSFMIIGQMIRLLGSNWIKVTSKHIEYEQKERFLL